MASTQRKLTIEMLKVQRITVQQNAARIETDTDPW